MISLKEFEALPPAIQRKCFSPVERLRIDGQSQTQRPRKYSLSGETAPRPATSAGRSGSSNGSTSTPAIPAMIGAKQKKISEEQARWFLMLPEKVHRQHFSREEHLTLLMRCKKVLEPATPHPARDTSRRCHRLSRPQSCMSLLSKGRLSTSTAASVDTSRSFLDVDSASVRTTESSSAEMKIFSLYSRHSGSVLTHNDIVANIPSLAQPRPDPRDVATPKKRPSFPRHPLTPLPLPPPTLAPPVPPLLSLSRPTSADSHAPTSLSARLSRPYMGLYTSAIELGAELEHETVVELPAYLDRNIRKQLRNPLLSVENVEEALEFGFAPEESQPPASAFEDDGRYHEPPSSESDYQGDIFNDEDEDDDDDEYDNNDDTSVEPTSPRTPTPLSGDLLASAIKQPSFDSGIEMSLPQVDRLKSPATCSPATSISNREMTIHMSLTQPDLRTPEDALYSAQRQQTSGVDVEKRDPLALQVLPVCDDSTGAHGAFSSRSSKKLGLKSVWKTLLKH